MYGLPDSAIIGTAKRLKGRRGGRKHTTEIGWDDFFAVVRFVKRIRARRINQKKRADFYKKHGYYQQ
jgi:hypothetical protein